MNKSATLDVEKPEADDIDDGEPEAPSAAWIIRRWLLLVVVLILIAGGLGYDKWSNSPLRAQPVVEEFFNAVIDRDIDKALSLAWGSGDGGPNTRNQSAFLHANAVSDGWDLLSVERRTPPSEKTDDWYKVVIGNKDSEKTGYVQVSNEPEGWKIVDPFVWVDYSPSVLTYLRINDKTIDTTKRRTKNASASLNVTYKLLPGLTTFFGDVKGTHDTLADEQLLMPGGKKRTVVSPPNLKINDDVQQSAQRAVNDIVDKCAESQERQPVFCPFGIGQDYLAGGDFYGSIADPRWHVRQYPRVHIEDPDSQSGRGRGMTVVVDDPGILDLWATFEDWGERTAMNAQCGVSGKPLRARLQADGTVKVFSVGEGDAAGPRMPLGLETCGNVGAAGTN